jgi:hypothetical protein
LSYGFQQFNGNSTGLAYPLRGVMNQQIRHRLKAIGVLINERPIDAIPFQE